MPILCSSIWELSYDKVHREKALSETSDTLRSLELIGSRSRVEVGALIATEIERDGTRIKWLSQMNLDVVIPEVFSMTNLVRLDLSFNNIVKMNPQIGDMINLQ